MAAKPKPRRTPRLLLLLLIPVVLFVAYLFVRHYVQYKALKAEQAQLQQKLDDLQYENALLDGELESAGSDSFIERMAREILGWIKNGEEKFMQDPEATPADAATPLPEASPTPSAP
ncbi:MAG: septum formation initiator family protein [Eubacteriales bacterium]|nr:septum formation initiator family protein [Eubacteriales bacterium]